MFLSKKLLTLNLFLCLFTLLFVGCSSSQEVEFEKSTGKVNKVKAGARFFINLSESHEVGSGLWSLGNNYERETLNYLGSAYKSENGGSVNFNFEALKKGKTEINLVQTFARDTLQTSSFVVEVE